MTVSHIMDVIGSTVDFEYQGDAEKLFRGIATTVRGSEVRRRFLAVQDRGWTRRGRDPYGNADVNPEQDIAAALKLGAEGIICSPDYKGSQLLEGHNVFFTPNTIDFTCRVIEAQRKLVSGRRTVAVTGSAGKTTTSAMIAHALRAENEGVRVQHDSRNRNQLRWALAHQTRAHRFEFTVLEVSAAALTHEWDQYAISADISVVTSITEAHLQRHGSLEAVARDKSNLFKRPPRDGAAVINVDAPHSGILMDRALSEGARLVTYGESSNADIRLTGYDPVHGRVQANVAGHEIEYTLGPKGKHMALNSLAVLATLRDLGKDWAVGAGSLETFVPPDGRGQRVQIPLKDGGHFTLIDGSYNANPASIRASLQELNETAAGGRKIAVLGDVLELGDYAQEIHKSLAGAIRATRLDSLHLLGENFLKLHSGEPGLAPKVHVWDGIDNLINRFPTYIQDGDLVLVKGSGATGLKNLAASLLGRTKMD